MWPARYNDTLLHAGVVVLMGSLGSVFGCLALQAESRGTFLAMSFQMIVCVVFTRLAINEYLKHEKS